MRPSPPSFPLSAPTSTDGPPSHPRASPVAFTQIVLSILATFGIYVLASLIHYDPWHMVTSLVQYLLIAPSYISVMNVYAFCNTHDVVRPSLSFSAPASAVADG